MKKLTISQLKAEANEKPFTCELDTQVQQIITKTTKGGKPYKELILADAGAQLILKLWENLPQFTAVDTLPEHAFLRLSGDWTQNQYGVEGLRWHFRELNHKEISLFLTGDEQTALQQGQDWTDILSMTHGIKDPRLKGLCLLFIEEFDEKFKRTAAARRNHHARRGGIVEHVAQMMRSAHAICTVYTALNRDLLTAGVLFHDCGKLWENSYPETGFTQAYHLHGEMLGHIPLGIELTNNLWLKLMNSEQANSWSHYIPTNEDVRLHLLHLIASHHGTHEFGSPTLPRTPEAHALHHIDNLDAKYEMFQQGYKTGKELAPKIIERQFPLPANLIQPLEHYCNDSEQPQTHIAGSAETDSQIIPVDQTDPPEATSLHASSPPTAKTPQKPNTEEEHFFGPELF